MPKQDQNLLTDEEYDRLEQGIRTIVPSYEMFDHDRFMRAMGNAVEGMKEMDRIKNERGQIVAALLIKEVCRDINRNGWGVPYIWWWIYMEMQVLRGIDMDPWAEARWWLWDEVRGTGKCVTQHGSQNCLSPHHEVRMSDGSVKRVDDVKVGDRLMGDDSQPRTVLSTCSGQAKMLLVRPVVGEPFLCTENHILTIICRSSRRKWKHKAGQILDIPAKEIAKWPESKIQRYGLISARVEFPEKKQEFHPYYYGLWLGDGTRAKPEITSGDRCIIDDWKQYFEGLGYKVLVTPEKRANGKGIKAYSSRKFGRSNPLMDFLRGSEDGEKFIRPEYLYGSVEQRMQLLAGLMDSDGHLSNNANLTLCCSYPRMMAQIVELVQSLGFRCTCTDKITNYRGKSGELHKTQKLSLTGPIGDIPLRLERRKRKDGPGRKRMTQNIGTTGFRVEQGWIDKFAGFEVDGNHRFLGKDYTVLHNSTKTSSFGRFAIIQMIVWGADAVGYIASPHKLHGEDKSWNDTVGKWGSHLKNNYSPFVQSLGISKIDNRRHHLSIDTPHGRAECKFVAADESSTVRGKKSSTHDTSGMHGITFVFVDEFVENPHLDLKGINSNASSNFNFYMVLACNPDPAKAGHPNLRPFSYPLDTVNMDRTRHFRWRTAYGLCVRFAWLNCPNKLLERTVDRWPYLLNQIRVDRARDKGASVIDTEIEAWCFGSGASGAPLDEAQIQVSGTYNDPEGRWTTQRKLAMFVDCAFGGRDPAVATILEGGKAMFPGKEGAMFERQTLACVAQVNLEVLAQFQVTQLWMDELNELLRWTGGSWPIAAQHNGVKPGDYLNGNYDCAAKILRCGYDYGVPANHIAFDSSQRGDITSILLDFLGRNNVRWYYEGTRTLKDEESMRPAFPRWPYVYMKDEEGKDVAEPWSTYCSQTISMVWFFACEFIKRGWLSRGNQCKTGLDELCSRLIEVRRNVSEGRRDVYSKQKIKDMGMASPAYGETLAFSIYFAVRYLGLIKLEEPKTAVHLEQAVGPQVFIRGGHNRMPRLLARR